MKRQATLGKIFAKQWSHKCLVSIYIYTIYNSVRQNKTVKVGWTFEQTFQWKDTIMTNKFKKKYSTS